MSSKRNKRQREEEAPVWLPRDTRAPLNYLAKHKQRDKGLEVVFDPKAHQEYLTGFHKRKVQRRKEALKKLEKRQREQRLEERAERRQAQKEELKRLGADLSASDASDDDDEAAAQAEQRQYTSGQLVSTVTVMPIRTGSSDSEAEEEADGRGGSASEEEGGAGGWRQQGSGGAAAPAQGDQHEQPHGRKLSKTALRIMTKTKMKIEGKKGGGGGSKRGGGGGKGGGKGGRGGGKRGGGKGGGGRGRR